MKTEKTYYKEIFFIIMIVTTLMFAGLMYVTNGFVARGLFFSNSSNSYMDFFNSMLYNIGNPYENQVFYPPFACMLYKLCLLMVPNSLIESTLTSMTTNSYTPNIKLQQGFMFPFLLYSIVTICILFFALVTAKKGSKPEKYLFTVLIFLSAPALFMFERANNIILVLSFLLLFITWYDDEKRSKREVALICLGIATALKIYPVLFCALLLKKKRIWDIAKVFAYTLVLTIIPLFIFYGGFSALANMFGNLSSYGSNNILSVGTQLNFGKCFILPFFNTGISNETLILIANIAKYVICIPAAIAAIFSKKPWIQATLCCAIIYGYQSTCATYLLVLFAIPLLMMLDSETEKSALNYVILGGFILLLSTVTVIIPVGGDYTRLIGTKITSYTVLLITLILTVCGLIDFGKELKNLAKKQ